MTAFWASAPVPPEAHEPTAIVESSPGHAHLFWSLIRPVSPREAEDLNRRILVAARADRSEWDLTQFLRPSGTRNRKYEGAPAARLVELDEGMRYHRTSWSWRCLASPQRPWRQPCARV